MNTAYIDKQIQDFIDEFEPILHKKNPSSKDQNDDCMEVTFALSRQLYYDDFAEELGHKSDIRFLYGYKENNNRNTSFVCFPKPSAERLCVCYIDSSQYGAIDEFHVAFFDSLEAMFIHLRTDLFNLFVMKRRDYPFTIFESLSPNQLVAEFF